MYIVHQYLKKMFDSVSDTGGKEKKILVFPIGVEPKTSWLLVLSYRRLVGAKAIKLVACVAVAWK